MFKLGNIEQIEGGIVVVQWLHIHETVAGILSRINWVEELLLCER